LSLFTPIMLEHADKLGPTIERIAWHKAGIIKSYSYAYSVPQSPEVLDILQAEAEAMGAEFSWIAPLDMAQYLGSTENGIRMEMGRYGDVTLSLLGRYQVANASLAVIGAGNMHARLPGISHGSPEYVAAIRAGLADVTWPGRCQKLQDKPLVYLDGAINRESTESLVESVRDFLVEPVISIIGVPSDKDYRGVYAALSPVSQQIILTETARNPGLHFPPAEEAVAAAKEYHASVTHTDTLGAAVERALPNAGTVLIVGTQSIVADAVQLWNLSYEQI
jgi:dihydrofolate synthase / folylpolyglutamate synthase